MIPNQAIRIVANERIEVLAHGVEETEVLGKQVVDRLEDELKKVGLHGRRLLRRKGVFLPHTYGMRKF